MKKYLAVLALIAMPLAASAQTSTLADPTPAATETPVEATAAALPDPTLLNFPRPVYFPHCAGGFAIKNHAVICNRVVSFYMDDTLDTLSAAFPRPVYKPECALEGAMKADGSKECLREVSFTNDAPPSLVLGSL